MSGKIARRHFLGQGLPRLGCAQAVAEAMRGSFGLDDDFVDGMADATGGRAPSGCCGAVYAAMQIAGKNAPAKKKAIEEFFKEKAGGVTCREIRSRKQLTCADCVEQAAQLLSGTIE